MRHWVSTSVGKSMCVCGVGRFRGTLGGQVGRTVLCMSLRYAARDAWDGFDYR